MALNKKIILDNGITMNYHRVVSVNNVVNHTSIIDVASYVNEEQREKEKEWHKNFGKEDLNVYIVNKVYSIEYDENLNVVNAYEYLKTLDEFIDAENN